jgi:hypothetical protein
MRSDQRKKGECMEFSLTVVRLIQSGVQKYKDTTRCEVAITLVADRRI